MSALQTAAQQALEALEAALSDDQPYIERCKQTIANLRAALAEEALQRFTDVNQEIEAALAEPVQEPVAWIYEFYADMGHKGLAFEEQPSAYNTPLYAAPPQRKPLTQAEIERLYITAKTPMAFARSIEQAHGITS